jgi:hypothetical protein
MNAGCTIVAQLMDFVSPCEFQTCVDRLEGSRLARYPVSSLWLYPPFPASCPVRFVVSPSPAPATANGAGGFPAPRFPVRFAPRVMSVVRKNSVCVSNRTKNIDLTAQVQSENSCRHWSRSSQTTA